MRLILSAVDQALAAAWHRFCGDLDFVEIHVGSVLDVPCDAVVSPANSFGFMDGGVDAAYLRYFGPRIQEDVRRMIAERYDGEMLVGTADIVETGDIDIPCMVVAPTMRVPMVLTNSVNAYLAARAALLLVETKKFQDGPHRGLQVAEKVRRLAFPGLGTGVGQMSPNICARQVRAAIDDVVLHQQTIPRTWAEASERHQLLYTDYPSRLQRD